MAAVLCDQSTNGAIKLTLNDPDALNAMSEDMAQQFSGIIDKLRTEKGKFRSIVITGAGRAFSAGGDLAMLEAKQKLSGEENRLKMLQFYNSFLKILELGVPVIAAINGHAVGAGLCLALACDIRIASENAKLGVTFTKLGLHPGMGGTFFLPRITGPAIATELMVTGRMIDASEALRIGLVSRVLKADELNAAAETITKEISTSGEEATRQVLETLRGDLSGLSAALQREALCQAVNYASLEFKDGLAAVQNKKPRQQ